MNFKLIIISVILGLAQAQWFISNKCPKVHGESDFQVEKFMGKWYEVKYSFILWKVGIKCVTMKYDLGENNLMASFVLTGTRSSGQLKINGTIYFDSNSQDAKFIAHFQYGNMKMKQTIWVLGTDYDNYAVLWSCEEGLLTKKYIWILSREDQLSADNLQKAYQLLKDNKISASNLESSDYSSCPNN